MKTLIAVLFIILLLALSSIARGQCNHVKPIDFELPPECKPYKVHYADSVAIVYPACIYCYICGRCGDNVMEKQAERVDVVWRREE